MTQSCAKEPAALKELNLYTAPRHTYGEMPRDVCRVMLWLDLALTSPKERTLNWFKSDRSQLGRVDSSLCSDSDAENFINPCRATERAKSGKLGNGT